MTVFAVYLTNILLADMPKIKVKKKQKKRGGFLKRYDFAQTGRHTTKTDLDTFKRIDRGLTENVEEKDRQNDRKGNFENNKSEWKIIRKTHSYYLEKGH